MRTIGFEDICMIISKLITEDRVTIKQKEQYCLEMRDCLNNVFPKFKCKDVLYTENTDNEFFGMRIYPDYYPNTKLFEIVRGERESSIFDYYTIELDNKLFSSSVLFSAGEICSLILNEINTLSSVEVVDNLTDAFHNILVKENEVFEMSGFYYCPELFRFVLMESIRYMNSVFCKNSYNDLTGNPIDYKVSDQPAESDAFQTAVQKIKQLNPEFNGENPTDYSYGSILLQWYVRIYKTINTDRYPLVLLKKAASYSGSQLFKNKIKVVIDNMENMHWNGKGMDEMVSESNIFTKMKMDGLKSIEDDLYEYKMRIRNVETQDDALLLMRQINNRMAILDQYLMENEDLPPKTRERWENVFAKYSKLREELSEKSVYTKKMYGLFVDYNALQQLSNNNTTMNTYY